MLHFISITVGQYQAGNKCGHAQPFKGLFGSQQDVHRQGQHKNMTCSCCFVYTLLRDVTFCKRHETPIDTMV